jgi:low temperature requirement protein LtrA
VRLVTPKPTARVAADMPAGAPREPHRPYAEVTRIELFFDLVYVYAVTQLAHRLARSCS